MHTLKRTFVLFIVDCITFQVPFHHSSFMIKINHDSIQFSTQLCLSYGMSTSAGENYPVQGQNVPVSMSPHPQVENVPFRVKMPQLH